MRHKCQITLTKECGNENKKCILINKLKEDQKFNKMFLFLPRIVKNNQKNTIYKNKGGGNGKTKQQKVALEKTGNKKRGVKGAKGEIQKMIFTTCGDISEEEERGTQ